MEIVGEMLLKVCAGLLVIATGHKAVFIKHKKNGLLEVGVLNSIGNYL